MEEMALHVPGISLNEKQSRKRVEAKVSAEGAWANLENSLPVRGTRLQKYAACIGCVARGSLPASESAHGVADRPQEFQTPSFPSPACQPCSFSSKTGSLQSSNISCVVL